GQNATLSGRALAFGGTVTVPLTPVTITVPACAALPPPPPGPPGIPTLDFIGLALLTVLLAGVGMFVVNKFSV
ncbi:MAG TPA: hypothetical protein VLV48_10910, partial [Thermoanaerobaculia bacterium]|nr:hypothetical protein [Thermoanaerobaculia bacterium]